jgi:single-strand DNA-binding protein
MRFTPSGTSVSNFGVAVNRRWTNKQGERVDTADYFNIVVWGKLAELCTEYLAKGSPVAVEGRLQSRSWETEEGQKRSVVEIVAENVQFLGRPLAKEKIDGFSDTKPVPNEGIEVGEPSLDEDIPF